MDFNQVSLNNKVTLNISTPGDTGISLNKGEVLKGQVQGVRDDGIVLLFIKGKLIEAATEVIVKSGQQLMLMVDEFKDGRTYLKVVNPGMMGEYENANIAVNLKNMGISPTTESVLLARTLLQYNLPVNQENMKQLSRMVNMLGNTDARNVSIATFALSRGIVNKPEMLALAQFVGDGGNKTELASLLRNLVTVFSSGQSSSAQPSNIQSSSGQMGMPGNVIPSDGRGQINLSNLSVAGEMNQSANITAANARGTTLTIPGELMSVNQGGRVDNQMAALLEAAGGRTPIDAPGVADNALSAGKQSPLSSAIVSTKLLPIIEGLENLIVQDSPKQSILNMLRVLQETVLMESPDKSEALKTTLKNWPTSEPEVIRALQMVKDLTAEQVKENKSPVLQELLQRVEGAEKEASGQRLCNYLSRPGEMFNNGVYYFSFPVKMEDGYQLCELSINHDGRGRGMADVDQLRVVVSLHTKQLGVVLFHVLWTREGNLQLQGVTQNENVCAHIENNLGGLIKNLENMGYRVQNLGVRVSSTEQEFSIKPQMVQERPVQTLGIDVRI